MTDQEKKFVLSKDTGTYSQLTPVSAPSTSTAEVKQISTPSAVQEGPEGEYLGNYYLLEVGSIEATPPTSPEKSERDNIPSPPGYPAPHLRNDIPPPPIEAPPQPAIISKSTRPPSYENVEVKPHLPLKKKRTKSFEAPQNLLSLPPPTDRPRSRTTRTSTYENVAPPFLTDYDNTTPIRNDGGGVTSPIGIQSTAASRRDKDYSDLQCSFKQREPEFKIVDEPVADQEDVVISSLNPNYMKVSLKNGPRPVESDDELEDKRSSHSERGHLPKRVNSPEGSIWFIPHESDPFAGLVQSSSVTGGMEYDDSPLPRDRLQSVWDDKRVSREWTQVTLT